MQEPPHNRELLEQVLDSRTGPALMGEMRLVEPGAAQRIFARLAADADRARSLERFLPHLLTSLREAAEPDRVLSNFERFIARFADPLGILRFLGNNPRAVEILVTLFAGSQFLTEILLRNPGHFERLLSLSRLAAPKSSDSIFSEALTAVMRIQDYDDRLDELRRLQSLELLRIGACDLLDLYDLPAVTRQLSNLADGLIRVCLRLAAAQQGVRVEELTVLALGKLGGRELNYSSDIDLLFLTQGDPAALARTAERLVDALARVSGAGFLYRVDMRLRPWGRVGPLVSTFDGYWNYLNQTARPWEKQALLKARSVAGDLRAGEEFILRARPVMLDTGLEAVRESVRSMKAQTESRLKMNGNAWGEVKLGEGSIRDVEFTAQFLQLAHGASLPEILTSNTLDALSRLAAAELITAEEQRILTDGYIFLRAVEHHLQLMYYRQTHSLPDDPAALAHLARRLEFRGATPGERFLDRYEHHRAAVRTVFLRKLGSETMPISQNAGTPDPRLDLHRHVDRMAPSYSERFTPEEIQRHAAMAGRLGGAHLVELDARTLADGTWEVTVVALDFPGELSLICGLFFVYGLNILGGDAFTYEPITASTPGARDERRKIVDVFLVQPVDAEKFSADIWSRYADDLSALLGQMRIGARREVQGELARRVATGLHALEKSRTGELPMLTPVELQVDNEISDRHTVLRIDALDTFGFLYELTNALAISRLYIERVMIETRGDRVHDTLYITDDNGRKISTAEKLRELVAAVVLIKHFTHLLPFSPNPESALLHFRDFIDQLFRRENWPDELTSLERPEVLSGLAQLLGVSDFLWDDFLRMQYANLFPVVQDMNALASAKNRARLQDELSESLRRLHDGPQLPAENAPWTGALNDWRDREMFRIDMRHILGLTHEFSDFAEELTDLAEVVVNTTFYLCNEDLRLVHGTPRLENGEESRMCVLGLGKFGGRELGFASDIELMFVYTGNGQTSGPQVISTAEFYEKLVEHFVRAVRARREGIFEIDLQLRPYGKAGSLAVSLDSFRRYFAPNGPAWPYERQALVKLRATAGDAPFGRQIESLRDAFVYAGEPFNTGAMRAMRERQIRHLVTGGTFNLKYSPGGLVDVEYLVQALQITHAEEKPQLRTPNVREAMAGLATAGILSEDDYTRLRKAHTFLRWLIDSLRVVRGNAKDVTIPPEDSEEYAFLARRMRYQDDPDQLRRELERYTAAVREINTRLLPA